MNTFGARLDRDTYNIYTRSDAYFPFEIFVVAHCILLNMPRSKESLDFRVFFSVLQRSLNNVRSYGNCVMVKKTFEWCNDISFRHVVTMFRNQVLYYILSAGICKSMCSPNQLTCEIHLHLLAFIDGSNSNSSVSIALYVRVDILRWNYYTATRCICTAGLWSPHPCHSSCALSQRRL